MQWDECAPETPVIVGVGEAIDRPAVLAAAKHPVALMADALREAEADTGAALIEYLDAVEAILQISWPYRDAGGALADELGIDPSRVRYGAHGGHSPMKAIHDAALRIARGECNAVGVCGGEAYSSVSKAQKAATQLAWPKPGAPPNLAEKGSRTLPPVAVQLGATTPVAIYPFYENATAAGWAQSPAEARSESGRIWSGFSQIASANPVAWIGECFNEADVTTPDADNRLIAWPYTKRMVANPVVNQGAAVIVTSLGLARELGIADKRYVAIYGGAAAEEPESFLDRASYGDAPAMRAVLDSVVSQSGDTDFTGVELYSCFPCVPKMARRVLALDEAMPLSLIGGLSFFGGPLNNYMTHATCTMVRRLRTEGGKGLLYAQGGYLTWHHALLLGRDPRSSLPAGYNVQEEADRLRGVTPPLVMNYRGPCQLETFTILYTRSGAPRHGIAILRTSHGGRMIARVSEPSCIARLTNLSSSPIGSSGIVATGEDGLPEWHFLDARQAPASPELMTQVEG